MMNRIITSTIKVKIHPSSNKTHSSISRRKSKTTI